MQTEIVNCDLCGSSDYAVVWDKVERQALGIMDSVTIKENDVIYNGVTVQCKVCGLIYIRERLTADELANYYVNEYRNNYETNSDSEHEHCDLVIRYLDVFSPKPAKSLDIGCSQGFLVKVLYENGIDAYGIDTTKLSDSSRVFDISLQDFDGKGYDLITIINTLEHMYSPKEALNKIHDMLTDDGKVLVVVPNFYTLVIKNTSDGFMSNMHLYHFDMYTLTQYLRVCGFKVIDCSIVDERNMQKLYILAEKSEKKPLSLKRKINTTETTWRINSMNLMVYSAKNIMQIAKENT